MIQDIAVIGASTAGLYTAELLARAGRRVTVYERAAELQPQPRTYIITSGLKRVLPDLDPSLIRNRIDRIALEAGGQKTEIELASPDLVLDRCELIQELARRARKVGAVLKLNYQFIGLGDGSDRPELKFQSAGERVSIQTDLLIGADGAQSSVRRSVNSTPPDTVPLIQAVVDLPAEWDSNLTKVWFKHEETSYFYWLIPDRDRKGVVGLIADSGSDIRNLLDGFLGENGFEGTDFQSGVASLHQRGLDNELMYGALPVKMVGDAAGQVKVTTVGGTVTGLAGAKTAADDIIAGVSSSRGLMGTERELDLHLFIRNLLQNMTTPDYAHLISSINPAVKAFLSSRDRDSMRAHFWKLAILQPRFIPLGFRMLLRRGD